MDGYDINILRSGSGPNRPALDLVGNGNEMIDLEHNASIAPGTSVPSLEPSTTHTQLGNKSVESGFDPLGRHQGSTSSTAQRDSHATEQESETVSLREIHTSLEVDSMETLRSSLGTSLEAKIMTRLEATIEAKLRAEFEANFEEKVKVAVDEQLKTRLDERLAEIRFFTPKLSGTTSSKDNSTAHEAIESRLMDILKEQDAVAKAISRISMDNKNLFAQSMAFQTLHDRHENSINAILTFLATVYNRTLDAKKTRLSI